MVKDQWMASAMADDALVVQLLLRLNQSPASPSDLVVPLSWGLRQPRSRSFPSFRCAAVSNLDTTRCSPSTPLSWTGLQSSYPPSDTSDDSIHPLDFSPRSKDASANASAAGTYPTIKGSRKRKVSAAPSATFEEQTANERKRMKLNLNFQSPGDFSCTLTEHRKESSEANEEVGPCLLPMHPTRDDDRGWLIYEERYQDSPTDTKDFLLPDLNMIPCDMENMGSFRHAM